MLGKVESALTLPLGERPAAEAIAVINQTDVAASGISTRRPTLDDVYLRLAGSQLARAA
jgi:hypothetical protein